MDDEAELVALRRRVRELEALEAVARAARAPIELDEALAALVESAAGSLHAEVCALAVASGFDPHFCSYRQNCSTIKEEEPSS